jgi:transposase
MIKSFGKTLQRWDHELENFCKYSTQEFIFTNAVTEALNNQCKVAKRVSM